jgi:hypothetical protein
MDAQTRAPDIEIVRAWLTAAADLGIKVTPPFTLSPGSGKAETFEALVHEFGGPKCTVTVRVSAKDSNESRIALVYYASNLSDSYRRYDRSLFVAILDDWKWFGPQNERPPWYTGRNWS